MRLGLGFAIALFRRRDATGGGSQPPLSVLLAEDGLALALEDGGAFILE
ncbi:MULTISPECIES: hypothetical protein [Sphingomonas]|nr:MULTISPECIES: hypothetical protein [Sphingomonas]